MTVKTTVHPWRHLQKFPTWVLARAPQRHLSSLDCRLCRRPKPPVAFPMSPLLLTNQKSSLEITCSSCKRTGACVPITLTWWIPIRWKIPRDLDRLQRHLCRWRLRHRSYLHLHLVMKKLTCKKDNSCKRFVRIVK